MYNKIPCLETHALRRMLRHGLDIKKGIATEEYRERMRAHVMKNGTLENLKKGAKCYFKKGVSHNYTRSAETLERLQFSNRKIMAKK